MDKHLQYRTLCHIFAKGKGFTYDNVTYTVSNGYKDPKKDELPQDWVIEINSEGLNYRTYFRCNGGNQEGAILFLKKFIDQWDWPEQWNPWKIHERNVMMRMYKEGEPVGGCSFPADTLFDEHGKLAGLCVRGSLSQFTGIFNMMVESDRIVVHDLEMKPNVKLVSNGLTVDIPTGKIDECFAQLIRSGLYQVCDGQRRPHVEAVKLAMWLNQNT